MASARVQLNNPGLLTWARQTAGYSVSDIAKHLGKRESDVLAWERGQPGPTFIQLERIAAKVKRPVSALFLPDIPDEPPPPADFRTLPSTEEGKYKSAALIAFREARALLSDVGELLEMLDLDVKLSLPAGSMGDSADSLASRVRSLLGIAVRDQRDRCKDYYEASDMWRDALFDLGVISAVFRMPMQDARAFSLVEGRLAAVGLNSGDRPQGRAFSLFHEVCHLCLGKPGVSGLVTRRPAAYSDEKTRIEYYCDEFAASFLLPADDPSVVETLRSVAGDPSRLRAEEAAKAFKVSKYVVLRRALALGYLRESTYWRTYEDWQRYDQGVRSTSSGGDYVAARVSRAGKRVVQLVFQALDTGRITRYDAGNLLGLDSKHFGRARTLAFGGTAHVE
jgi:Zn-dependent peptidase ImmA (M78 family)/DNA-binding XRE family transcriptional regulator